MRKRAMELEVDHERKSDGVTVHNERKYGWGES